MLLYPFLFVRIILCWIDGLNVYTHICMYYNSAIGVRKGNLPVHIQSETSQEQSNTATITAPTSGIQQQPGMQMQQTLQEINTMQ